MTNFYNDQRTRQMEQLRKSMDIANSELVRTTTKLAESLRPSYDAQNRLAESLRPFYEAQNKLAESLRPIYDNQFKLAHSLYPVYDVQCRLAESLGPMNHMSEIFNNQFADATRTIRESLVMNTKWVEGFQGIANLGSSLSQLMEPFNNILAHSAIVHQEQMQRIFQSIPRVSYDTDFANINLSYINELVVDIANESVDADSLVLTESELQQVLNNIDIAMQGVILTLDEYFNMLYEYAANAPTNVKIFMLDFIKQNIFKVVFAFLVCCDLIPLSAGLTLVTSQLMAAQKASEKSAHKLSAITNKPMQIRKSLRIKAKI